MAFKKKEEVKVEIDTTPIVEVAEKVVAEKEVTEKFDKEGEQSVRIRMRVNHRCTIAKELYDLKADKVYVVPENVKRILNNAGLLAPL